MLNVAIAVCGTQLPKTTVAPTNGAVNSQILAHTTVENAQIFFFSSHTNSVVHVVSIANVDDIATLDTMDIAIRTATRASPLAVFIQNSLFVIMLNLAKKRRRYLSVE